MPAVVIQLICGRRRRGLASIITVLLLLAALSACANVSAPAPDGGTSSTSRDPLTPYVLPGPISLTDAQVTVTPIDVAGLQVVPVDTARAATQLSPDELAHYTPYLARYSDDAYGSINADNSVTPSFQNRVAWVFVSHDESGIFSHYTTLPTTAPPTATYAPLKCITLIVVDADTGEYMNGAGGCE